MDIYTLIEKVNAELVLGRAQVRHKGEVVIIGRPTPGGIVMTAEGKKMADALASEVPVKKKRVSKAVQKETTS